MLGKITLSFNFSRIQQQLTFLVYMTLQEANDRILQARVRVAQQKARHSHAQNSVGLPNISASAGSKQAPPTAKSQPADWSSVDSGAAGGTFLTQPPARTATVA